MKKQRIIVLIVALLVAACALCACDNGNRDVKGFISDMKSSMNDVTTVKAHVIMHDNDVLVYEYQKTMEINGSSANIEITEKTLNSNFKLATNTSTSSIDDVDRTTLLPVALSEWSADNATIEKNSFSCVISVNNFASVLKVGSYKIREDATLSCDFSDKKLTKISCDFITEDGKTVSITYDFAY